MTKANILINLGAPKGVTEGAAKEFLIDLLSDPFVIQLPYPFRHILAKFIAKKRCNHYLSMAKATLIEGEFPIVYYTKSLAKQVENITKIPTYASFQIGNDSIAQVVTRAKKQGAKEFNFIPLYPQNSYSMTQSAKNAVEKVMSNSDSYRFIESYHDHPSYIDAIAESIKNNADIKNPTIFSFHSVPIKQLINSPYKQECQQTVKLVCEKLNIDNVKIGWQSKMGKGEWLSPSTLEVLDDMSKTQNQSINIICAGFSCDCTETLIEINTDARAYFLEKTQKQFNYIKCLNNSATHAWLISKILWDSQTKHK